MSQTHPNEDARFAVRQVQRQFWVALQTKDEQAFARLLAEDFVSRSPRQPDQGRDEFIETLTGFSAQVRSVGSDNLEVHVWGDVAVVTGVQTAQLESADGQVRNSVIAITNIFQWQQGGWVMKLAHAVSLE